MRRALLLLALLALTALPVSAQMPNAWINEFHYDNGSGDTNEFIEVVVQDAKNSILKDLEVRLYNQDGNRYGNIGNLDDSSEFVEESTIGDFTFYVWRPSSLQDGPSDGFALCDDDRLIQALSYEGTFTTDNVCNSGESVTSDSLGVSESSSTSDTESLQLTGTGSEYTSFSWTGPSDSSPGQLNTNQTLSSSSGDANPNEDCPAGTELLAKYEFNDADGSIVYEKGIANEITFSDSVISDENGSFEWVRSDWDSGSYGIVAVILKGGGGSGGARPAITTFSTPTTSGTISNDILEGQGISNVQYCIPNQDCPQSTVEREEIISNPDGSGGEPFLAALEFENTAGIEKVEFIDESGDPDLDNLTVVNAPSGFTGSDQDAQGNYLTWTWTDSDNPPTTVEFEMQQVDASVDTNRYFALVTSTCGATFIDPPFMEAGDVITPLEIQGNYPNPMTDRTTIAFRLREPSPVQLSIYDITGRKVATLIDREMAAGVHEIPWDGATENGQPVSSGVYFYRLETGSQVRTERLVVVR